MSIKYSIIIPVKEINDYIRETVPHILKLDFPAWELIILPNEFCENEWLCDKIRILPSGRVGPAAKRDLGAMESKGEILVFLDDDSFPSSNYLSVANDYLDDEEVVALGGPGITPQNDSFWQKVSGAVFVSRFSGGAPERYLSIGVEKQVYDWPSVNLIVKKSDFIRIGGFNTEYWPGEDTKLCLDLLKNTHKKILYIPQLVVWHHRRSGLKRHLAQIGAYGLHRGFFFKKYPETSRKLLYLTPSLLAIYLMASLAGYLLTTNWPQLLFLPLYMYLLVLALAFLDIWKKINIRVGFAALPYVLLTHIYYGVKFLQGIFTKELRSRFR